MTDGGFAYSHLFAKDLPPPAPLWTGFPKYNFIGGHNDPVRIPAAALAEAAATVLQRRGPIWRSIISMARRAIAGCASWSSTSSPSARRSNARSTTS